MHGRKLAAILLTMCLAALACNALSSDGPGAVPTPTAPEVRSAQLTEFQKIVEWRAAESAAWSPASVGQTVLAGGSFQTGDEARARIDTSEGTVVRLAPRGLFRLDEFSLATSDPVTRLWIEAGKVWVSVASTLGLGTFEVETPAGSAGVRGSLMSVEYDPSTGTMTVTCLDGQCYLTGASGATTDLGPGEQASIFGPGQDPTTAQPMEDAQLAEWALEFPEAQTAVATVTASPRPTATPQAQSACDHPYLPLRQGATWQLTRADTPRTWRVEAVSGDLSSARATVSDSSEATALTYTWECTAEGIAYFRLDDVARMVATILTYYSTVDSFYGTDSSAEVAAINYTMSGRSGVSLPADLKPGASWDHAYTIEYQGQPAAAPDAWINYLIEVSESHAAGEAVQMESAWGTLTAIPVVVTTTGRTTSEFSHGSRGFGKVGPNIREFASTTTVLYAADVGLVRLEWTSEEGSRLTVLEDFFIP